MPHRIEIALRDGIPDPRGESIKTRIKNDLKLDLISVRTINIFTLNFDVEKEHLEVFAKELFRDKVIECYSFDKSIAKDFDYLVEKSYKPGVTDNVGKTAKKNIEFYLNKKLNDENKVYYSVQYLFKGSLTKEQFKLISKRILGNDLIENFIYFNKDEFDKHGVGYPMPIIKSNAEIKVNGFELTNYSDDELLELSKNNCWALDLKEFHIIKDHFNDNKIIQERKNKGLQKITDVELEIFAQTWSEHCKHKEFDAIVNYKNLDTGEEEIIDSLFKTYIQGSTIKIKETLGKNDYLIKIFNDNAGIVKYDEDTNFVFKVETHNSPSALDPYGGAITGIVGVNRDPAGTGKSGATPLFNTNVFCFANPFYNEKLPPNTLHPMVIFEGVHRGVKDGGNQSGIPTLNGSLFFDDRYMGKPLVYCGTGALMPNKINNENTSIKTILPGYLTLMTGGRVGKDGIHGVTMASEERNENTPISAVQIGDAITQKIMLDYIFEMRDQGWIRAITDNGGGGLSSSTGEIARISNGVHLDLKKVPLKYHGLQPWEIFISESQERMTFVIDPKDLDKVMKLAIEREVEVTVLGEFTDSGYLELDYGDKKVAYIDMKFLHEGLPKKIIEAQWKKPVHEEPKFIEPKSLLNELSKLLSSLNICSKEYIVRPYDHEVKGSTIIKPLSGIKNDGPSDASVIAPKIGEYEALVVGHGICPRYSDIDAYHMSACAFDEMVRNIVATGGKIPDTNNPIMWSINDNFCCPDSIYDAKKNPDGKLKFAKIVRANKALYDYTTAYNIPLTSGKDSMKNDFKYEDDNGNNVKISIPLTLLYSGACKIEDYRKCVTIDVKKPNDLIYILGETKNELGASEYFKLHGFTGNNVPKVNAKVAIKLYHAVGKAMDLELIESCHDCSDGGLAVSLAESAFSGGFGMDIDLVKLPKQNINRTDFLMFSESQSRFIVTIQPKNKEKFEEIMKENIFANIGTVIQEPIFRVKKLNSEFEEINLQDLKIAWQQPLRFDLPLEKI